VDVGAFLVTNAEAAELIEPSKSSLHNPTPSPKAATVPRVALCQEGLYATNAQTLPYRFCIVCAITQKAVGTTTWASTPPYQGRNSINKFQSLPRVVTVRPS
jgi:hypothetical protein